MREREPPARMQRLDAALEAIARGEGKHGIDALRCKTARGGRDIAVPPVHRLVGTETAHERNAIFTRGRRQHFRAAQLCELHRERTNGAARAMNDQRLAALNTKRCIDALQRCESARAEGTSAV